MPRKRQPGEPPDRKPLPGTPFRGDDPIGPPPPFGGGQLQEDGEGDFEEGEDDDFDDGDVEEDEDEDEEDA